ncbi:MAG: ABC transporter substrate-binding protein [Chloroflexota bacterium]|nr:ABC transporter substrate-binding protein [Chloroflexota bacterium]
MVVVNTRWHIVSVAMLAVSLFLFTIACSGQDTMPAAPAEIDLAAVREVVEEAVAASAAESVGPEEIKSMVEQAVASSAAENVSPEEIRVMVEEAVATASSEGLTADEVEAQVAKAVSEALSESAVGKVVEPASFVLTDVAGRTVTIQPPVERIILGEGRQIYIAAALQPGNPFNNIVGWRNDLRLYDADAYSKYVQLFPEIEDIEEFGSPYSGDFSVERAIAVGADVVTLNLGGLARAREAGTLEQLSEAGIPVVVIDYRQEPLENTVPSTYLLGRLLGQEERAQGIVDFYLQQVNLVYSRVGQLEDDEKPLVFMDTAAGIESAEICCRTFGRAGLGLMIERAGGINMGSGLTPGFSTEVNPEQIIVAAPDVIIATGSNWSPYSPDGDFVSLGYFTETAAAQQDLKELGEGRPGWSELDAINNGRHHAVWHQFYNSPYHFVVLQQFAKWFHPELFEDIDPVANFAEFHEKFLPIGYSGTFMVSAE